MYSLDYSVEDYIMVVEGCVESLPAALKSSSFESVKNDLFLVYHYLNECCGYGNAFPSGPYE